MKGLSIALRVIAILGAAAAIAAWAMTKGKVEEAERKITTLENRASALSSDIADLESQLVSAQGQRNAVSEELADAKARVNALQKENLQIQREVSRSKTDKEELTQRLAESQQTVDELRREILDVRTNRPTTPTADTGLVNELEDKIAALENELANATDKLAAANLRARSGPQEPSGDGTTRPAVPGARPTIAQLNAKSASILRSDPERGILIISRGQVDGLQRQMELNVAKGLERTVRVKVGTVAPTYSVAYVLPGQDPSHLQEGDQVNINQ